MSVSAVVEAHRPVQDGPVAAITDMPSFEGAPVDPVAAQAEKPEFFIPHNGQLVMSDRGITKSGMPSSAEYQEDEKVTDLSRVAGAIFHGVARTAIAELGKVRDEGSVAVNGLRRAILTQHRNRLHAHSPALYRGWARKSAEMMPELMEALLPGPGYTAHVVPESSLTVDDEAKAAVAILKKHLEEEQSNGDGKPGPFEKLMLAAPSFQLQGRRTGKFTSLLKKLPDDFPLTQYAVRKLTRKARTHMFIKGGNIIAPPTSRPDVLEFVTEDGDEVARQAAEALSNVFAKDIGFDPDRLASTEVSFSAKNKATDAEETIPINALDAVHWAVGLIGKGRITPCVLDIKLQPHVERPNAVNKWSTMNQIWNEENYDLAKIFSQKNLNSENAKYADLQKHWSDMERDAAATTYSVLAFFRMAEREFRNRNPGAHEPLVRWEALAKRMHAGIILVDFDISKEGEPLEYADEEPSLEYRTLPPLEEAGVPKDVSIMLRPVEDWRLQKRLQGREREMRRQYMKHHLGKVATQAVVDIAA